jgi:hypothetical protein
LCPAGVGYFLACSASHLERKEDMLMVFKDPLGRCSDAKISRLSVGGFLLSSIGFYGVKDFKTEPRWRFEELEIMSATEEEKSCAEKRESISKDCKIRLFEIMALLQSEYTFLSLFRAAAAYRSISSGEDTLHP